MWSKQSVRRAAALALVFGLVGGLGCTPNTPTSAPPAVPTGVLTPAASALPTITDSFYGSPLVLEQTVGKVTQRIRIGTSPDFASRPILPFFGIALTDPESAAQLMAAINLNHYYRWQEADWAARSEVSFKEFIARLADGEDLSYPAMDTRNGAAGAHLERINPASQMDILLIPRHEGFVTFPAGPTDPGLSVKNTINPDGSVRVRVPIVYAQIIAYPKGAPEIQEVVTSSVIIALMELGIPPDLIAANDLKGIREWWENQPRTAVHAEQYEDLKEAMRSPSGGAFLLRVLDSPPDN